MIKCLECGASQYEGAMFCSECGQSLLFEPAQPTEILPFSKSGRRTMPAPLGEYKIISAAEPRKIIFVLPGRRDPITLELVDQLFVGRFDTGAQFKPELDLTGYEGMDMGVSRKHAVLQMSDQGIVLMDLGSTNGTMLNNGRLPPEKPFPLRPGDEIRFGDLLVHVFFEL